MNLSKRKIILALLVNLAAIAIVFLLLYTLETQAAELPTDNPSSVAQAQDKSPSHDWSMTIVDDWGITGWHTSLALEPTAPYTPHISYYASFPNHNLNYASWNGAGWVITTVDSLGIVGYYTSLALEPTPPYTPHISYYDYTNGDLKHAWLSGTAWVNETIDSAGNVGSYTSLALEPTLPHTPHISYYDVTNSDLKYAHRDGGGWVTKTVDSEGHVGWYTSLALEPTAPYTPHISYYASYPNYDLKHAWLSGTVWISEVVDSGGTVGSYTSLALEPTAPYTPHVSYRDFTHGTLKYAFWNGAGWVSETVDSGANVGWYTSLALETTAPYTPHISYYDFTNRDLKHAWLSDTTIWLSETVDSGGSVGRYNSADLITAASYTICISYHDDTNDALKLACSEPPAPHLTVTKQADPAPVLAGAQLTYTLTVANIGNVDLHATVTDTLPAQVTPPGVRTWTPDPIIPGGVWTKQFTVTVDPDYIGTLPNLVQVTTVEGVTGTDSVTVTVNAEADLAIAKTVNDICPSAGDDITYTITIVNNGPSAATGVVVSDLLPSEVTFGRYTASQGLYTDTIGVWDVGGLAVSQVATLTIMATVSDTAGTTITNTAVVSVSDQPDPDLSNDAASEDITVSWMKVYLPIVFKNH